MAKLPSEKIGIADKGDTVEIVLHRALKTHDTREFLREHLTELAISSFGCVVIYVIFVIASPRVFTWYVLPCFLCGCLIGKDAVRWLRGRINLFDPAGIIGVFGVYFFYVAPLLNISQNYWLGYMVGFDLPSDWRPWIAGMGLLNLLGIVLYQHVLYLRINDRPKPRTVKWQVNGHRARIVIPIALVVAFFVQISIYKKYGGISGFMAHASQLDAFEGMGTSFTFAGSFPIVFMMGIVLYTRQNTRFLQRKWLASALLLYLGLQMFFGGLSGSRSSTVWAMFWAVGLIHFWLRPVRKRTIALGLITMVAFMYVYGFYKDAGAKAFQMFDDPVTVHSPRTLNFLMLEDFARSDIQAYILHRLNDKSANYQLAMGRTYVGALASIIPHAIWSDRPPTKAKEGTEIQYGTYDPPLIESHRVYGLAGETMLNFGYVGVPFAFIVFGIIVKCCRNFIFNLQADDARLLIAPYLTNLCIVCLAGDSDNIMYFLVKYGLVPFLVVWFMSKKVQVQAGGQPINLPPTRLQIASLYR